MATALDERELETLRKGATGSGMLVAVSDRSFFDSFKEGGALARHLAEARRGSSSELIKEVAEGRGTGFGLTDSPEEIERETMEALRGARTILESKSPQDLEEYRSYVLELARSVAAAAAGGDEAEAAVVRNVQEALG
jgi:hypothetical protein